MCGLCTTSKSDGPGLEKPVTVLMWLFKGSAIYWSWPHWDPKCWLQRGFHWGVSPCLPLSHRTLNPRLGLKNLCHRISLFQFLPASIPDAHTTICCGSSLLQIVRSHCQHRRKVGGKVFNSVEISTVFSLLSNFFQCSPATHFLILPGSLFPTESSKALPDHSVLLTHTF